MFSLKRYIGSVLLLYVLAGTALAQQQGAPIELPREPVVSGPLITAAATAKRVRFVSPGTATAVGGLQRERPETLRH